MIRLTDGNGSFREVNDQTISISNPLFQSMTQVMRRVSDLKDLARKYYLEVVLSPHECPDCGGHLQMVGQSQSACPFGHVLDPTLSFQRSPCCSVELVRKTFHYACSRCNQIVPSRFLFDERIFNKAYFREMMQESRSRDKKRREELRKFFAESRSNTLTFLEEPDIGSIPGLAEDLNAFVGTEMVGTKEFCYKTAFSMTQYREHVLPMIGLGGRLFSTISPMSEDSRKDKAWRFITLLFMEQDREVTLTQYGQDLLVERFDHEAYA